MDIGHHHIHAALHNPGRATGEHHALVIQAAHQHLHAAVVLTKDVLDRHLDVVEHQLTGVRAAHAQLVQLGATGETSPIALDDKGGDAVGAKLRFGLGVNDVNVRVWAVSDPHLAAIEHEVIAPAIGPQLHADHIGTGVRLTHRQRPDMLTADQLGQVFRLLLRRTVAVDLAHAQVGMRPVGQANRRRPAADLLHRHHMRQIPQPRAAILLRHGNAQQSHVTKTPPHLLRKLILPVDLGGTRRQLGIN